MIFNNKKSGYTEFIGEPILFDKYQFPRYPSLTCFADGKSGRRYLFISDKQKSFVISFEEGMKCLDQRDTITDGTVYISSEYQCDGRYIHQLRTDPKYRPGIGNYAFFHMQFPDKHGVVHILPGQMVANNHYQWAEGVEQILIDILKGVSVRELFPQ